MEWFKNLIENLEKIWLFKEKKSGLLFINLFALYVYFKYLISLLSDAGLHHYVIYYAFPTTISIIILLVWLLGTKRIYFKPNVDLVIGLILKIDDSSSEYRIKKLTKSCIEEINEIFPNIRVFMYPINFKRNAADALKYLGSHNSAVDVIMFAEVETGNMKQQSTIDDISQVKSIYYSGQFAADKSRPLFNTVIRINEDLSIRNQWKDWSYVEGNSLLDKSKMKSNLKDSILHFIGLYFIYHNKLEQALTILRTLHDPSKSKIDIDANGRPAFTNSSFVSSRLSNIMLNLYMETALTQYHLLGKQKESYMLLKECESIFPIHSDSYHHYIQLARLAYEDGNLQEAISYTGKARGIRGETIEVLINGAFFSILKNDINGVVKFYKKIIAKKVHPEYNIIYVIDFLVREREKYPSLQGLFDFSLGILNVLFSDRNEGVQILKIFCDKNESNEQFYQLVCIAEDAILVKRENKINLKKESQRKAIMKRKKKRNRQSR